MDSTQENLDFMMQVADEERFQEEDFDNLLSECIGEQDETPEE